MPGVGAGGESGWTGMWILVGGGESGWSWREGGGVPVVRALRPPCRAHLWPSLPPAVENSIQRREREISVGLGPSSSHYDLPPWSQLEKQDYYPPPGGTTKRERRGGEWLSWTAAETRSSIVVTSSSTFLLSHQRPRSASKTNPTHSHSLTGEGFDYVSQSCNSLLTQ